MESLQFARDARVIGSDGDVIGTLIGADAASQPPSIVVLLGSDGRQIRIPYNQIDVERSSDGEVVTTVPGNELLRSVAPTWNEHSASGADAEYDRREVESQPARETTDHATISLAAEELVARTRDVEKGRVIVRKRVETIPHEQTVDVEHDEVDVDRVTVSRDVDEMPSVRHEGDTMIVPVVEEVLVVEKRLRVVEELRVTKRRVREETTIREDLRREVADIETEGTSPTDTDR